MKARDVFGIVIRTIGVVVLLYGFWFLAFAVAQAGGLPQDTPGEMGAYFTSGIPAVLVGLFFSFAPDGLFVSATLETEMIQTIPPDQAQQRTRHGGAVCNPRAQRAGSPGR